ncbi:MAG: YdcH family protein [Hyphomicrobiales bacterium]|nr:YdcH family protein [Hyphomicrobiales bacterium]MCY4038137.1 YdcH family protein [Hyphomicrobiales bacterium]
MSVEAHIASLREKHSKLDEEIKQETLKNPGDNVRITTLKREKLRIKDEIERLIENPDTTAEQ